MSSNGKILKSIRRAFHSFTQNPLNTHSIWLIALVWGLAYFCILYVIGIPVEEYDGMNRRLVAESIWTDGPMLKTWFDFGSIFSFYLFYFPASILKEGLNLSTKLSDVALQLHSGVFSAAIGSLMLVFVLRWIFKEPSQNRSGKLGLGLVLSLVFFCNPLAYSSERYLIETPLAFYLLAVVYLYTYDQDPKKVSYCRWLLIPLVAMAVWTRGPSALFFLPLLALSFCRGNYLQAFVVIMGLASGSAGSLWWNHYRYGSIFGYSYGVQTFDANTLHGLYAFIFSPGLGIFTFYPLSILAVVMLLRGIIQKKVFTYAISCSLLIFTIIFSSWCVYNGGLSYGPRFLIPLLPILGVYGILELRQIKLPYVKWILGICIAIWGAYINLNSLLLPPHFFYLQWAQEAPIWDMPAEEKQIQMNFAERLAIYDPAFSHYMGSIGTFLERRDVWELPFIKFASRDVATIFTLKPHKAIQSFSFISRGSKAVPWVIRGIKITELDGKGKLDFYVIGDDSWNLSDDQKHATNNIMLRTHRITSGTKLILSLDRKHEGGLKIEMNHGKDHVGFPYSYVIQQEPGTYFRGNGNDRSYIPFKKSFHISNRISGLEKSVILLIVSVILLLLIYFRLLKTDELRKSQK